MLCIAHRHELSRRNSSTRFTIFNGSRKLKKYLQSSTTWYQKHCALPHTVYSAYISQFPRCSCHNVAKPRVPLSSRVFPQQESGPESWARTSVGPLPMELPVSIPRRLLFSHVHAGVGFVGLQVVPVLDEFVGLKLMGCDQVAVLAAGVGHPPVVK